MKVAPRFEHDDIRKIGPMGIAAYNRGSKAIIERISMDTRPREFVMMDILNGLQKYEDAGTPFGTIHFVPSHGGCFAECPKTGFGFFYPNLYEAVKRWRVRVTEYRNGVWVAVVNEAPATVEGKTMIDHQVAEQHEIILAGLAGERAHSRIAESNGRPVQWTYNANGSMATVKTPGQFAYERDLEHQPAYNSVDHGTDTPRPTWHELSEIARWSWEQNPTDRF